MRGLTHAASALGTRASCPHLGTRASCPHPVLLRLLASAFALATALTACTADQPAIDVAGTITIAGATLIDGAGAEPIEDAVVIIRGDRIERAGARADVPIPEGGEVIDATGKFLIPGLIDLHNHYRDGLEEWAWRLQLHSGVLTVRSLGSDQGGTPGMIAGARAGNVPAPRIFTAGLGFTHPEGFPPNTRGPATEEEAREMVRELAAQEVDLIKMWVDTFLDTRPKIEPEIRSAIADEATKHGIPVSAHVFFEDDIWQLVDAGVRSFVHGVRDQEVDDEFVRMAQETALSFAPALGQGKTTWYVAEHPELLDDPELVAGLQPPLLERLRDPEQRAGMLASENTAKRRVAFDYVTKFVRRIERRRRDDHGRFRQRRRQHRLRLGHPPRAGSPGRGRRPDRAAGACRRRGQRRRCPHGRPRLRNHRGGQRRGPDPPRSRSTCRHPQHPAYRARDAGGRVA